MIKPNMDQCNQCSVRACQVIHAKVYRGKVVLRDKYPKDAPFDRCRDFKPIQKTGFSFRDSMSAVDEKKLRSIPVSREPPVKRRRGKGVTASEPARRSP